LPHYLTPSNKGLRFETRLVNHRKSACDFFSVTVKNPISIVGFPVAIGVDCGLDQAWGQLAVRPHCAAVEHRSRQGRTMVTDRPGARCIECLKEPWLLGAVSVLATIIAFGLKIAKIF
jgi:hypothetical protein